MKKKTTTKKTAPKKPMGTQTALQYNRALINLCAWSGKGAISLDFLKKVHPIIKANGGIGFTKEHVIKYTEL